MDKILLVEDEDSIREMVALNLKMDGYTVDPVSSAEKALELYNSDRDSYVLMLIDIMLPGMSGVDLCQTVRREDEKIGVIMLTAKTQFNDKMIGFASGADDYITKPFSITELLARVKAVYRRCSHASQNADSISTTQGIFTLDIASRVVRKNDRELNLTQVEFQLMRYFFEHEGVALQREDILKAIWGENYYGDAKIVDVNIKRLRMKVEDDPQAKPQYILTVWGYGYRWDPSGKAANG
ncbi:MAG: response regulator transcription factor [Oscillospiraceae bacterium]|nr:response regulator transcription factor [Oscillospiraceae bacterium]